MTDRALVFLARSGAVGASLLALFGILILVVVTPDYAVRGLWQDGGGFAMVVSLFLAGFGWLVVSGQPRNPVVWSMLASALGGGAYIGLHGVAVLLVDDPSAVFGDLVPAQVPPSVAILTGIAIAGVYVGLFAWITFGLLLFPDGRPPSPRWRWVAWQAGVGIGLMVAGAMWERRPWSTAVATESSLLAEVGGLIVIVAAIFSLAAIAVRFRRSTGIARDQLKWVAWGASILVPWFVIGYVLGGTQHEDLILIPVHVAVAVMLTAYGIAVGRYRLFDVDRVISRTIVYGTLGVVITGLYVGAVVGVGEVLLGAGEGTGSWSVVAIPASALVAVAFQPLRRRLQRAANRVVYGRRATPYEVLAEFGKRVGASDGALLGQVTRSLVEGTGAEQAVVWVAVEDGMVPAARWPREGDGSQGQIDAFAIHHDGAELGRLTLTVPPGERLPEDDRRLAAEVASGLGLALRNQRLTRALQTQVDELRESRRRLVTVQDSTRRKLERDLHDGAQQQLVALKVKLGLARAMAAADGAAETAAFLERLGGEADEAVESLRDFARGVYSPLLEAEGLEVALSSQARRMPVAVALHFDGVGRYPAQVEATVYFCVLEALQNAVHHGEPSEVRVAVVDAGRVLHFEVSDDGIGFDPGLAGSGTGLTNLRDRLDAVGGSLSVESSPGAGATVQGTVPLP